MTTDNQSGDNPPRTRVRPAVPRGRWGAAQVAARLGVSDSLVRELTRAGFLRAIRINPLSRTGAWSYDPADVEAFIRRREAERQAELDIPTVPSWPMLRSSSAAMTGWAGRRGRRG